MKLYTEEQLFDICQSVAEKICANSLPTESIIDMYYMSCKRFWIFKSFYERWNTQESAQIRLRELNNK